MHGGLKVFIIFISLYTIFISCKKNHDHLSNPIGKADTLALPHTGAVFATERELDSIPLATAADTSSITVLGGSDPKEAYTITDIPVADSQVNNGCVGWALGYGLLTHFYRIINDDQALFISPSFVYNSIHFPFDNGASMHYGMNFIKNHGSCNISLMAKDVRYDIDPSAEAKIDAEDHIISDYERIEPSSLGLIKSFLKKNIPIPFGVTVDTAFLACPWPSGDKRITRSCPSDNGFENASDGLVWRNFTGGSAGGHAMLIVGFDDGKRAFLVLNSWGTNWGNHGLMWIDYDLFSEYAHEAYRPIPREVFTLRVKDPKVSSADVSGRVYYDHGSPVTERGICYSTSAVKDQLTVQGNKVADIGAGTGKFTVTLNTLAPAREYFVRAYAIIGSKPYYGNIFSFTTVPASLPKITTTAANSIISNAAISGGIITDSGGVSILAKGLVYGTDENFGNSKTIEAGPGSNTFQIPITGLTPNTKYFVKAYATNSAGTAYGNVVSFTTAEASAVYNYSAQFTYDSATVAQRGGGFNPGPFPYGLSLSFDNGIITGTAHTQYMDTYSVPGHSAGTVIGSYSGTNLSMEIKFDDGYEVTLQHGHYTFDWVITGTISNNHSSFNGTFQLTQTISSLINGEVNNVTLHLSGTFIW